MLLARELVAITTLLHEIKLMYMTEPGQLDTLAKFRDAIDACKQDALGLAAQFPSLPLERYARIGWPLKQDQLVRHLETFTRHLSHIRGALQVENLRLTNTPSERSRHPSLLGAHQETTQEREFSRSRTALVREIIFRFHI